MLRFEFSQDKSEQEVKEVLYTENEIWDPFLDEVRTCLLDAA